MPAMPTATEPAEVNVGTSLRVALAVNALSGRGKGGRVAEELARALKSAGHDPHVVEAGPRADHDARRAAMASAGLLVVVGGDGTLHHLADEAVEAQIPVYHAPVGNENLFARELGSDTNPETLVKSIERLSAGADDRVDVARCDGRSFLLMWSLGFDAGVVCRLARSRVGGVSHLSYVTPTMSEALRPNLPRATVRVDGETVVDDRQGTVIVANCRRYAVGLDPARDASFIDGELDVVHLPGRTTPQMLWCGSVCGCEA